MKAPPRWAALTAVLTLGWLAGCSGAASGDSPRAQGSIQVGRTLARQQVLARTLDSEPRSLDPLLGSDVPGQRVSDDLFEGLTSVGMDGRAVPGVASSWDESADQLTWTFHLRPDARWSNGAPVTAGDFVYSWRREVDPRTGAPYAEGLGPIRNALKIASGEGPVDSLGVQALDAHTLRVQLEGPTPFLLDLLCQQYLYPVYAPAVQQYGEQWSAPGHIVSNGAFRLVERVIGNRITLERNPYYWDASNVRLQRVIYYVLDDYNAQEQRYLAGDAQWTDTFVDDQYAYLKSRLGEQVVVSPYFGTYMLTFNMDLPPYRDNSALRQALSIAIDREPLVRSMRPGYEPAYTLMPPLPGYTQPVPSWTQLSTQARHALARELYQRAGYSAAHPLHGVLVVPIAEASTMHIFEALTAQWRAVLGADIQLDEREFKVLLQERDMHKLELAHGAWIGDYPDPYTFMQIFYSGNGNNSGDYSNHAFDALIDRAGQEKDNARRFQLFEQAETYLNEDEPYLPIFYYVTHHLVKPFLRGWQSNIMDRNLSRYMYLLDHQGS